MLKGCVMLDRWPGSVVAQNSPGSIASAGEHRTQACIRNREAACAHSAARLVQLQVHACLHPLNAACRTLHMAGTNTDQVCESDLHKSGKCGCCPRCCAHAPQASGCRAPPGRQPPAACKGSICSGVAQHCDQVAAAEGGEHAAPKGQQLHVLQGSMPHSPGGGQLLPVYGGRTAQSQRLEQQRGAGVLRKEGLVRMDSSRSCPLPPSLPQGCSNSLQDPAFVPQIPGQYLATSRNGMSTMASQSARLPSMSSAKLSG